MPFVFFGEDLQAADRRADLVDSFLALKVARPDSDEDIESIYHAIEELAQHSPEDAALLLQEALEPREIELDYEEHLVDLVDTVFCGILRANGSEKAANALIFNGSRADIDERERKLRIKVYETLIDPVSSIGAEEIGLSGLGIISREYLRLKGLEFKELVPSEI